jgi:biotin transport system substrate-specific component
VRLAVIRAFFACLAGTIICYFFGTLQYVLITQTPIGASLAVCVLPFLPIDICKALLAAVVGKRLRGLLPKRL